MIVENHITVSRNARYFSAGEVTADTKNIWIVLHGHRQLAGKFILLFEELQQQGSVIYAPEGLMRLYVKGDSGDVGASWMTKEDRLNDINDYVNYLDKLFFDIIKPLADKFNLKINTLGFSQGSATLARWLALGKARVNKAVFWCGSIANDLDYSNYPHLKNTEIFQVFAAKDPYYKSDFPESQIQLLKTAGIESTSYIFDGGHEISVPLMREAGVI